MKLAKKITVYGRVQGVGFRYYALQCAREQGLQGWVKNTPKGTVEIHCEGEAQSLGAFIRLMNTGPAFAKVSAVDEQSADLQSYPDFQIRY